MPLLRALLFLIALGSTLAAPMGSLGLDDEAIQSSNLAHDEDRGDVPSAGLTLPALALRTLSAAETCDIGVSACSARAEILQRPSSLSFARWLTLVRSSADGDRPS